jgi:hypothetical protein
MDVNLMGYELPEIPEAVKDPGAMIVKLGPTDRPRHSSSG